MPASKENIPAAKAEIERAFAALSRGEKANMYRLAYLCAVCWRELAENIREEARQAFMVKEYPAVTFIGYLDWWAGC